MSLDVCYRISVLPLQLSLVGRTKKKSHGAVSTVRRLGHHGDLAPGQVVGNDENRVDGGIVVVELDDVFEVSPHAHDPAWQFIFAEQTLNGRFFGRQRRQSALL